MRRVMMITLLLLMCPPLQGQQDPERQPDPQELEARLAEAVGSTRLDLLIELCDAYRQADPIRADALGTEALALLATTPDDSRRIRVLLSLAEAQEKRGKYKTSLALAEEAEQLSRESGDRLSLAWALYRVGVAAIRLESYPRAQTELTEAISMFEELGAAEDMALALRTMGNVSYFTGNFEKALSDYLRARDISEEAGNPRQAAACLANIALVYWKTGRNDRALEMYEQALETHQKLGLEEDVGRILYSMGQLYRSREDPSNALEYFLRALEIREQFGIHRDIAITLTEIGNVHLDLGNFEQAMAYYRRALPLVEEIDYKAGTAWLWNGIGQVNMERKQYEDARMAFDQALTLGTIVGDGRIRSHALRNLSQAQAESGRSAEGFETLQRYAELQTSLSSEEKRRSMAEMQARFDVEQKEKEIELLEQRQAVAALEIERQRDIRVVLVVGFVFLLLMFLLLFNRYRLKSRERLMADTVRREREASARLREVDKLKDEFLANTSHELRTPLYGITGLAESLIDGSAGALSGKARGDLGMIVSSGRRLSNLVNGLLDFSKLRHESLTLTLGAVDLHALSEVILAMSRPLVGDKKLQLENLVPDDFPPVEADEARLQQILHNLVGNAVKFTVEGQVTISAEQAEGEVVVRVADTGVGVREEQKERIFDSFQQGDASTARSYGGTGLGLAVTRQLVHLHGGEIQLDSSSGDGATFFFNLALADPERAYPLSEAVLEVFRLQESYNASPTETGPIASGGTAASILIVDDEPVNRRVLANHLASASYELREASSGLEALERIAEEPPDLVLLDVMMPVMSGLEVCRQIRLQYKPHQLPVVFLTAKSQVTDLVSGLLEGGNDYLVKPIAKEELLARIHTHLDLRRFHVEMEGLVEERMAQIKVLQGLLPMCSNCKKVRSDDDYWEDLETYVTEHSEASFSHGMCTDCAQEFYPEFMPKKEGPSAAS